MQPSKRWNVSRVFVLAAAFSVCQLALADETPAAAEAPMSKQVKSMVDFQCHGAKTLKQAEANRANMARDYTDQHPVMVCLNKKVEELRAAAK